MKSRIFLFESALREVIQTLKLRQIRTGARDEKTIFLFYEIQLLLAHNCWQKNYRQKIVLADRKEKRKI